MCRVKIGKTNKNPICQFKVHMVNFNIAPPLLGGGNCSNDVFVITGQNENNILPKICGFNDGQHYYFAVDESGVITFNFMLNYNHYYHERKFNIQLTQIPCSVEKLKAPPNCLQYLTGTYGTIKSFNYQVSSSSSPSNSYARGRNNVNSDASNSGSVSSTTGYPNDLDYSICFKKEPGFCSITYELASAGDGRLSPFEIGTSETLTGHRIVSSFTHSPGSLVNSLLSSRSSNRDVSKFNVLSNNHVNNATSPGSSFNHSTVSSSSSSLSNHLSSIPVSLPPSTTVIASQCTEDYLIVGGGIRLCSASIPYLPLSSVSSLPDSSSSSSDSPFNGPSIGKFDLQSNHLITSNNTSSSSSSVVLYTDFTSGPFNLRFVSNSLGSARGFNLIFRQNPCNWGVFSALFPVSFQINKHIHTLARFVVVALYLHAHLPTFAHGKGLVVSPFIGCKKKVTNLLSFFLSFSHKHSHSPSLYVIWIDKRVCTLKVN